MSCYNCTKKFGLFCGEKGCPDCGFSFCSGCLKFKVSDGDGAKAKHVCGACNKARQHQKDGLTGRAPPDALEKRLSALVNPPPPNPITVYMGENQNSRIGKLKRGLSKEDTVIAERLEKLKKDRKASMDIPSEVEMAERLAKLKGVAAATPRSAADERALKGVKTDLRPDVVRTDDLVKAVTAEVEIDANRQRPEDEVAERLARLRGQEYIPPDRTARSDIDPAKYLSKVDTGVSQAHASNPLDGAKSIQDLCKVISEISVDAESQASNAVRDYTQDKELQERVEQACKKERPKKGDTEMNSDIDSEDDEEQEAILIERILAEAKLEEDLLEDFSDAEDPPGTRTVMTRPNDGSGVKSTTTSDETEELPWCVICNEDAALRCHGCEGDLYCRRCLQECHDEYEIKDHKFVPYKEKKGPRNMH